MAFALVVGFFIALAGADGASKEGWLDQPVAQVE